jgi:PPP family 3-phenylpropionic acid transporter
LVLALGPMVERFGAGVTLPAVALALLFVCLTTILIPEPDRAEPETSEPRPRHVFGHRQTTVLLTCCLLMQASHAPYYAFFSIYLSDQGYAKDSIGALWAFGVVCEVAVFFFMHRLLRRFPAATLLAASFVVTALRWTLIALYPQSLPLVALTQSLHAITFGVYHAAALQLIRGRFTGRHQHRGVALYGSVSFGIGGALGSLYSGYLWSGAGPEITFLVAAGAAAIGAVLAGFIPRRD